MSSNLNISNNYQMIIGICFWIFVVVMCFYIWIERNSSLKTCTTPVIAKIVSLGSASRGYYNDLIPKRSRYCRVAYRFKGKSFCERVLVITYRKHFSKGEFVRIYVDPQNPSRCITKTRRRGKYLTNAKK